MFWADYLAEDIKKKSGGKPQLVNDAKTPSGKIHVGALLGVLIHDFVHKSLLEKELKSRYTFGIDDFDPMDSLPTYLPKEKYEKYMGAPLKDIPAPEGGGSYAEFYANEFIEVFNRLGAEPEIIWSSKLYEAGKFDESIKTALDNAEKIQEIYHEVSGSKKEKNWLPFNPVCPKCGKIGTTKSISWDGREVEFSCEVGMVEWAKGCGYKGKITPFGGAGKMPYKVEWPAKWFSLGVTVEGEGKDHSSKGGTRDVSNHIAKEVFKTEPPYDIPYEHFLLSGKKMSSSKGVGATAADMAEILPPSVLRFLMARTRPSQHTDFNPEDERTVPALFDEYDRGQRAFFEKGDPDLARTWQASIVEHRTSNIDHQFMMRFSQVVNLIQMPGVDIEKESEKVKGVKLTEEEKDSLRERVKYAKIWLENFAPDEVKFRISEKLPPEAKKLSLDQKRFLEKLADEVGDAKDPEKFQNEIYQLGKEHGLSSTNTFKAIYTAILGKESGPKAAQLILGLDKEFVNKRLLEVAKVR